MFSPEFRSLVPDMLMKDPEKRPSINDVLGRPFIRAVIRLLLQEVQTEKEQRRAARLDSVSPARQASLVERRSASPNQKGSEQVQVQSRSSASSNQQPRPSDFLPIQSNPTEQVEPLVGQASQPTRSVQQPQAYQHQEASSLPNRSKRQIEVEATSIDSSDYKPNSASYKPNSASYPNASEQLSKIAQPKQCSTRSAAHDQDSLQSGQRSESPVLSPLQPHPPCMPPTQVGRHAKSQCLGGFRPKFLQPDGAELKLHVNEADSLFYRIEALRVYLEKELGLQDFIRAYQYLCDQCNDQGDSSILADAQPSMESLVGPKTITFLPLIHQLIVCEDASFSQTA